ncbi:MAG: hypothetical protein IKN26_02855 [Eubacterium sp.]|nr:hypothetical protein [Eubacterium sp.]MBR4242084.1 hypothetical protein [Eubacterium sp.]
MTVKELCGSCGFEAICLPDGDKNVCGAYIGDLLSWVMGRANEENAWITIMNNVNVIAVASLSDVACVILAEGVSLDDSLKETAIQKGINFLKSPLPAYETAQKLIGKV